MRKVKRTQLCEKETFIADDGEEFSSESECIKHEIKRNDLKLKLRLIERCAELEGNTAFDGGEYYESHSYEWYKPRNEADVDVLNSFYDLSIPYTDVGRWLCIETADDHNVSYYTRLDESIAYARTVLKLLGVSEELLQ